MVDILPDGGDRDRLIQQLDEARHLYERARQNRIELVLEAREHGMSFHQIALAIGLTEGGARKLAERATAA